MDSPTDIKIIAGDFNEDFDEGYETLRRTQYLLDEGFSTTNETLATEPQKNRRIDWIFAKAFSEKVMLETFEMNLETKLTAASDHLMTGMELKCHSINEICRFHIAA